MDSITANYAEQIQMLQGIKRHMDYCRSILKTPADDVLSESILQLTAERDELRATVEKCIKDIGVTSKEKCNAIDQVNDLRAKLEQNRFDEKEYIESLCADLCKMEDALGFKNDCSDAQGAFIPTIGPWLERLRDLIAAEGELGDATTRAEQAEAKVKVIQDLIFRLDRITPSKPNEITVDRGWKIVDYVQGTLLPQAKQALAATATKGMEVSTLIELESACNNLIKENEDLKRSTKSLLESLLETTKHLQNEWEDHLRPFCHDDFSKVARDVINRACKAIAATGTEEGK